MRKLSDFLAKLIIAKFYGEVVIRFEAGHIVHVKKTESFSKEQFSN